MKHVPALVVLLVICLATAATAQLPRTLDYQGVLTDAGGAAVGDGLYSVTFNLYEVEAGGTEIWTETQAIEVYKGIFNVVLGTVAPLELPFDGQYWLGISIEAEPELSPRIGVQPEFVWRHRPHERLSAGRERGYRNDDSFTSAPYYH